MNGDSPMLATKSATARGMPRNAAALPRIEAPSRIMAIIEQVSTAPIAMSRSACSVSPPCSAATMSAPSTPTAALSDGVAMPPYIEPSTAAIRKIAGASSFSARDAVEHRMRLRSRARCPARAPGASVVWIITQAMKQPASRKPGMKPAVNSLRIETSPSTP